MALEHQNLFTPGQRFGYSNTNYLLAGLIVEKVTGRTLEDEVGRRILRPLRLRDTSLPGDETGIRGPHASGYIKAGPDQPVTEFNRFNPSVAWASGDMISSGRDLNRFFASLIGGRLLGAAELREMTRTRDTGRPSGQQYGLGLARTPLPGGGDYWGHDGDSLGFSVLVGVTTAGRQVTVMVNLSPGGGRAQDDNLKAAVTTALRDDAGDVR